MLCFVCTSVWFDNCVAAKGVMCFSCVASAAHFLFYRKGGCMKREELKADVAKRMRFFRKLKGVSAKQMSLDIGKAESYISKVENGQRIPSLDTFAVIIKYLGITFDLFLGAKI